MSAYNVARFGALLDSPHLRLALSQCPDAAARLRVVENLRRSVTEQLQDLVGRVHAFDPGDNDQVVVFVLAARRHATPAETKLLDLLRACVDAQEAGDVPPYAELELGTKMKAGRKAGTVGPLRKWVEKHLAKYHTATPSQAWEALKRKPPKGIEVDDNLAPTLWVDGRGQVTRKTFQNLVAEVKKQRRR